MESKMTKFFRAFFTLLAVLIFGMCSGLIIAVNADTVTEEPASLTLKLHEYRTYTFYPDGYKEDNQPLTPFSGNYVFTGSPNEDVIFKSYDEPVTYNVIFHSLDAVSSDWYGMVSVDPNVTLNITVYGESRVLGHNHPGINLGSEKEGAAPVVNINMTEGSRLEIGCTYSETEICIAKGIEINLGAGATTSIDMSAEGWQDNQEIVFTNGTEFNHQMRYFYADDENCRYQCVDCDIIGYVDESHYKYYTAFDPSHEDYSTKHTMTCEQCLHNFESVEHTITYESFENGHMELCRTCRYEGELEDHEITNGTCTVCEVSYLYKHEAEGVEAYVFFTDTLVDLISEKGGTVTVLQDVNLTFNSVFDAAKNVTIDLAGKKLYGISFYPEDGATITVIDSSADKSGVWCGYKRYDSPVYGTLILEGITVDSAVIMALNDGALVINDVNCLSWLSVIIDDASVEIDGFNCNGELAISLGYHFDYIEFEMDNVKIAKLNLSSSVNQDVYVNMLLPEGYAFFGEDGLVDGSGGEAIGITAIIEHTQHNNEKMQHSSAEHWMSCTCGYSGSNEREMHVLGEDNLCTVCDALLVASVTANGTTKYFTSLVDALLDTNNYQESTVVLLADFQPTEYKELQLRKNVTLDLNGFTYLTNGRLLAYAGLTINDSSEEQTGKLLATGDISYIIQFHNESNVTLNGGEYFGLIYGAVYTGETATITINGGRYLGKEKFRLNAGVKIIVNGGVFECAKSVFDLTWSSAFECEINGGVFINSTVFCVYDNATPDLESMVGTDGECELWFISTSGKVLTVQELCDYYEGEILVFHKDTNGWANSIQHGQYCTSCEAYSIGIEHSVAYEPSNDGLSHTSYCVYCNWQLTTNEQHTGGEATCTERMQCQYCSSPYGDEPEGHVYDNECDSQCNVCENERETPDHVYDNECDSQCNECEKERETPDHVYDNECDSQCNVCENERETPDHVYDNECDSQCNVCENERETPDHVYDNECDNQCNVCKETRKTADHVYENGCDTSCDECGHTRETTHSYANGVCTSCGAADPSANAGATDSSTSGGSNTDNNVSSADKDATSNGNENIEADNGIGAGAIVAIVIGSLAILGGGFAIYIRKKKFSNI